MSKGYQLTNNDGSITVAGINNSAAMKVDRTPVADAAYPQVATDYLIVYTSISTSRIVTLLAAATAGDGAVVIVKDESGSVTPAIKIIVDGNGAETIDGVASIDITAP